MRHSVWIWIAVALLIALVSPGAAASELTYTFVDFGALSVDSDLTGTKSPTATQRVAVESGDGDGLTMGGSLAVGQRFYLRAGYESSIVDVDALITSPLATVSTGGNFDLVSTRVAFGYVQPLGSELDLYFEASYDTVDYDFGSFAGESFDAEDGGAGFGVGLRWNPNPSLEVFIDAHGSSVGEVNLSTSELDSGVQGALGLRFYFFRDLGLGFDLRSGDVDTLNVSLRFGFGELRAGRN
jgi:hypothetical protein